MQKHILHWFEADLRWLFIYRTKLSALSIDTLEGNFVAGLGSVSRNLNNHSLHVTCQILTLNH